MYSIILKCQRKFNGIDLGDEISQRTILS